VSDPHVHSYNCFVRHGLQAGIRDVEPAEVDVVDPKLLPSGGPQQQQSQSQRSRQSKQPQNQQSPTRGSADTVDWDDSTLLKFWVQDVTLAPPTSAKRGAAGGIGIGSASGGIGGIDIDDGGISTATSASRPLLPRECRERGLLYGGQLAGTFCYQVIRRRNGAMLHSPVVKLDRKTFGDLPVMVLSDLCHLRTLTPSQLVQCKEEVRVRCACVRVGLIGVFLRPLGFVCILAVWLIYVACCRSKPKWAGTLSCRGSNGA
jgi:RNA polymerase beta subunit